MEMLVILAEISSHRGEDKPTHFSRGNTGIPSPIDAHRTLHALSRASRFFRAITLPKLFASLKASNSTHYFLTSIKLHDAPSLQLAKHVVSLHLKPSVWLDVSSLPLFTNLRDVSLPINLATPVARAAVFSLKGLRSLELIEDDPLLPKYDVFDPDKCQHLAELQSLTVRLQGSDSPFWPVVQQLCHHFNIRRLLSLSLQSPSRAALSSILECAYSLQSLIVHRAPHEIIYEIPFSSLPGLSQLELHDCCDESETSSIPLQSSALHKESEVLGPSRLTSVRCPALFLPFFEDCPLKLAYLDENKWDAELVAKEMPIPSFPQLTTLVIPRCIGSYIDVAFTFPALQNYTILPDYQPIEPEYRTYTPGWL
jgi:hypothetical protein